MLVPPPVADAGTIVDHAAELFTAGRLDDAAAACRRALDEDPDLVSARSLLGMVEEERGNLAEALAEFEAVIRLAPERTAERERADRLRPQVMAQAAPAIPDDLEDGLRRRRWIAAAIGGGVLILVLLIGALVSAANRAATPAGGPGGGEPGGLSARNASGQGAGRPTAAGAANGEMIQADNLLAGPAIGQIPQDQTPLQPNQGGGGRLGGGSTPPPVSSMNDVPMPPPTVPRSGVGGPLVPPTTGGSSATPPAGSYTGSQPTAPAVEQPRGRVRIWMGEPGAGTTAPTTGGSVTGMSLGNSMFGGNALRATSQGYGGAQPIAGASRGTYPASSGAGAAAPRAGTSGYSAATPRSGSGGGASQGGRPQLLSPPTRGTSGGAVPMRSTGGGYAPAGSATAPVRTASTSSPLRTQGGRPAPTSGGSSRGTSSGAAELRARAQSAMVAGKGTEARSLYAAAIAGYEAEARRNPERSAASRSAAESCRRALEALGGGR